MNPFTLLTKGHTIVGLEERPGAYKLSDKNALPNFSGPKRLAPTTTHPRPENAQSVLFAEAQAKAEAPAPPAVPPAPPQAPAKDLAPRPGLWRRLAGKPGRWMSRWIPWRKRQPFQSAAVQTELVLDKVKVIRNDLNEDDVEVVMIDNGAKVEKPAQGEKVERDNQTAQP